MKKLTNNILFTRCVVLTALAATAGACGGMDGTDVPAPRDVPTDVRGGDAGVANTDVPSNMDVPNVDVPDPTMEAGPNTDVPTVEAGPDVPCAVDETLCNGVCTATQTDRSNCGLCGNACPVGQVCSMGTCGLRCTMPEMVCGAGASMRCVNPTNDRENCGGCDIACRADQQCTGASCVCTMGRTNCNDPGGGGSSCVDTQSNAAHCGACGMACPPMQQCRAGRCELPCAAPTSVCGAGAAMQCVNLSSDNGNCGACGTACNPGSSCRGGTCMVDCAAPGAICNVGGMDRCINITADLQHCGRCNNPCAAGQNCIAGNCQCLGGGSFCGGACVDPLSNPNHCGGCNNACPGAQMCVMGRCALSCPIQFMVCGAGAAMICVNPQTDANNCGACNVVCPGGQLCVGGSCRAPAPANDAFAAAINIPLGVAESTVAGTTVGATFDGPAGCSANDVPNVWYRFTLATRELVYADTAGSAYDTRLYLTDALGALVANTCNDDASCATGGFTDSLQSRFAVVLNPGTYYIAVSGFSAANVGTYSLHLQHLATNRVSNFIVAPISGNALVSGALAGASVATSNCGGTGSGEDGRWFMTCGATNTLGSLCMGDGGTFLRRNNVFFDPSMYLISGISGTEVTCNDDGGGMGGVGCTGTGVGADAAAYGSRVNFATTGRGIHLLVVDERGGGPGMTYTMRYTLAP